MSKFVQRERHGAVALLRLNRPEALNALSDDVLEALCAAFDAVEESPEVRCVVLCGAGRAFAAGADVAGLARALGGRRALGRPRCSLGALARLAPPRDRRRARLVPRRRLRAAL